VIFSTHPGAALDTRRGLTQLGANDAHMESDVFSPKHKQTGKAQSSLLVLGVEDVRFHLRVV